MSMFIVLFMSAPVTELVCQILTVANTPPPKLISAERVTHSPVLVQCLKWRPCHLCFELVLKYRTNPAT